MAVGASPNSLMPVHSYAPSAMPGESIFGQSFIPVTDTQCWIHTYAWNPERPLTQARREMYAHGNGVISEVDGNYVPLRNMVERFGEQTGYVGRPRSAAAERRGDVSALGRGLGIAAMMPANK